MLSLEPAQLSRSGYGRTLYVEYLEVAPWNQAKYAGDQSLLRGVGKGLLTIASQTSRDLGCRGALALHALPPAVPFYLRHGLKPYGIDPALGYEYLELAPQTWL